MSEVEPPEAEPKEATLVRTTSPSLSDSRPNASIVPSVLIHVRSKDKQLVQRLRVGSALWNQVKGD